MASAVPLGAASLGLLPPIFHRFSLSTAAREPRGVSISNILCTRRQHVYSMSTAKHWVTSTPSKTTGHRFIVSLKRVPHVQCREGRPPGSRAPWSCP